ncbi:hypothetical protein [Streptomyces himastatinicus]|uniref:hypothetical protein n=1 Tax=Streptomyces himastatinicus TaxID=998084 RepID=UPI0001B4FB70
MPLPQYSAFFVFDFFGFGLRLLAGVAAFSGSRLPAARLRPRDSGSGARRRPVVLGPH